MIEKSVGLIVIVWLVFRLFSAILIHVRASIYDFLAVRRTKKALQHPNARHNRSRPLVSIIIPTHNAEQFIEDSMKSILRGSYRKFEIIVVDGASVDQTKQIVRTCIADHPKQKVRLVSRRTNSINDLTSVQKYIHGELIMMLDPCHMLAADALHKTAYYFAADSSVNSLSANIRLIPHPLNSISLLQQFEYILATRVKKSRSLLALSPGTHKDIIYRNSAANSRNFTTDGSGNIFAHNVTVYARPSSSYKQLFKDYSEGRAVLGVALLDGLVFAYLAYLAIVFHSTTFFVITWTGICAVLVITLWSDEHLANRERIRMSLFTPIMYSLFLLRTMIRISSVANSVLRFRKT